MQGSVQRHHERHGEAGDHRQRQPAGRQRNAEGKAAQHQRAEEAGDIGPEPRPSRADGAVMADQDVGQHDIGEDDRGGIDQGERVASR